MFGVHTKVDWTIDRVESLERAVGECRRAAGTEQLDGKALAGLCGGRTAYGIWCGTVWAVPEGTWSRADGSGSRTDSNAGSGERQIGKVMFQEGVCVIAYLFF